MGNFVVTVKYKNDVMQHAANFKGGLNDFNRMIHDFIFQKPKPILQDPKGALDVFSNRLDPFRPVNCISISSMM